MAERLKLYICKCGWRGTASDGHRHYLADGTAQGPETRQALLLPQTPEQQEELVERVAEVVSAWFEDQIARMSSDHDRELARTALRAAGLLPEEG